MNFKTIILSFFLIFVCNLSYAQVSTYTFIDPCTKEVSVFSVPIQGGKTMIIFLDNVGYFDANDLSNGTFTNWVNQTYTKYRQTNPCSQQQGQVTQNQITAQIIGGTIQSVVSSILSSSQAQSTSVENGSSSSDAGGKDNKNSEKKKNNNSSQTNGNNSSQSNTTSNTSTQNSGQSQSTSGSNNSNGGSGTTQGNGNTTNGGGSSSSGNTTQGGNSSTQPSVGSQGGSTGSSSNSGNNSGSSSSGGSTNGNSGSSTSGNSSSGGSTNGNSGGNGSSGSGSGSSSSGGSTNGNSSTSNSGGSGSGSSTNGNGGGTTGNSGGSTNGSTTNNTNQNGEEVGATTQMNNDAHNDNNAGGGSNGGGKGKSGGGSARSNPIIVSSDVTSAQNLNRTFTPIVNIGTSKSSMTGLSSYGVTGMVWLNFKQFAVSTKYTKIHYSKSKKLKFIHNVNLTGVYTYGNYLGFIGYSGILNGGKYGITGFNISAAATIISEEKNGYYSPSITAFYTRPFKVGKKLIVSPELYVISTPLVYSSKDNVSITDRYVSGFVGSGFDYQISKRFKLNVNYKANMSTNPEFPILSFFLIGSKINL